MAGIGVAVAVWGTRLLLQAASSPKFQEAMREDAKPESPAKRASKGPSNAPASAASYFTTDVMGVDLGQGPKEWSSACVAVVEDGEARVVESAQGQRHTPSLVVFQDNGELVGQPALRLLFSRTDTAVHGHQLLLGVPFDSAECEEVARALPLNLTPGPDGNVSHTGFEPATNRPAAASTAHPRDAADGAPHTHALGSTLACYLGYLGSTTP